ncbi:MAG: alpha/beta hydrolase family protein [Candidatus Saccharimonadales bacterium]
MSKIHFNSDGYRLAGNLYVSKGSEQLAFLFIQGWTGHQNIKAAQVLSERGYTSMTYDMRGNRESEGNLADFTRADFLNDAIAAYDYLKNRLGENKSIGVVGSSFGSYTAVLLSEKRDVSCLSLRVPASYPDSGFNQLQLPQSDTASLTKWRKRKLDYTKNHAFKALHKFKGKVQIIEAEADDIVPSQATKNYADSIGNNDRLTYEIVPNAPHRLETPELQEDYENRLIGWVQSL